MTNFDVAVMKIDIEGWEHRAFTRFELLLAEVKVLYVFMEWTRLREYYGSESTDTRDKRLVQKLVEKMTQRLNYKAYGINTGDRLDTKYWYGWPSDIVWVHEDAREPLQLINRQKKKMKNV